MANTHKDVRCPHCGCWTAIIPTSNIRIDDYERYNAHVAKCLRERQRKAMARLPMLPSNDWLDAIRRT